MDPMWLIFPVFGLFAVLQATGGKMKDPLLLTILFILGPFGFLSAYFNLPFWIELANARKKKRKKKSNIPVESWRENFFNAKSSDELRKIYNQQDNSVFNDEDIKMIRQIMTKRGERLS